MRKEDLQSAAFIVRKYSSAVATTLYWSMSTNDARKEISEAERIAGLLESEVRKINETS